MSSLLTICSWLTLKEEIELIVLYVKQFDLQLLQHLQAFQYFPLHQQDPVKEIKVDLWYCFTTKDKGLPVGLVDQLAQVVLVLL